MKALEGAINKEKGLVGAFSMIVKLREGLLTALVHLPHVPTILFLLAKPSTKNSTVNTQCQASGEVSQTPYLPESVLVIISEAGAGAGDTGQWSRVP